MQIFLTCDGTCEPNPGQMAIGCVATYPTPDGNNKRTKILEISEKVGSGTNNQAEYLAVLRGLEALKAKIKEEKENIPTVRGIRVFTDSQLVVRQLNGEYEVKDAQLGVYADAIMKLEIPGVHINFIWQKSFKTKAAHNLAMKALLGEQKFKAYLVEQDLIERIQFGEVLIPLSIFKTKKWERLTVSECIVVYLLETCGKSVFQVSDWLGRSKSTIRTQYARAKKKLPTACNNIAMPANYAKKEWSEAWTRKAKADYEAEGSRS